jgi:LPXTG-motif cell wall-anchored protein
MLIASIAQTTADYLLDDNVQKDAPLPIFKSLNEILKENLITILVLLAVILMGLAVWYFLKKKKEKVDVKVEDALSDPYEDALQAISDLQRKKSIAPKPLVFRLSEILRVYVERLFNLPAMELTGEEFMREIASHSFFKNRYEETLQDFIQQGDQIKYSKKQVTEETTKQLVHVALNFVKDTKQKLEEEQKESDLQSNLNLQTK